MPENLWDTSALVKLYLPERGSARARELAAIADITIASITIVEVASALRRRILVADITADDGTAAFKSFLADAREFVVVETTQEVRGEASRLLLDEPLVVGRLRGFDAIQLASARLWFEVLRATNIHPGVFVVADNALRDAALAIAIPVENPEDYE